MAVDRVRTTPQLLPYARALLELFAFNEGDGHHWDWVATADLDILVAWCQRHGKSYADYGAARVDREPELEPYRDVLIEYEWENQAEHLAWVTTAPVEELVSWAKAVSPPGRF